jgi:TldD protein
MKIRADLMLFAILWATAVPSFAGPPSKKQSPSLFDRRQIMLRAMEDELDRSTKQLKIPEFEPPYFIAFEMKDMDVRHVEARYGALFASSSDRSRRLRVEIRVGSYQFDNIGSKASDFDFSFSPTFSASKSAPKDNDPIALRNSLWLLSDENYKAALKSYLKRKGKKVTEVEDEKDEGSFSKEPASTFTSPEKSFQFDTARFEKVARTVSDIFERHPAIFDSYITIDASKVTRTLINSEGTRIVSDDTIFSITLFGATRAPDGMLLTNQTTLYAKDENKLPADKEVLAKAEKLAMELEALQKAPVIDPYTGPAIFDGDATGVLFHEVIGHRLEGERQLDEEEGKTFKGQIGNKILPDFLSVIDDPTLENIGDTDLNGTYQYDDEGVRAQRVVLIDHGALKSFLTSRTPIEGVPHSNGHGRAAAGEKPRARMGNTLVESGKTVPFEQLKKLLIEEVKKQGKPYGLIIKNIVGGSTHTSSWGYQAYKGIPQLTYRIFPDGREELVRGVEIVGTPIASINKILVTSDKKSIFNGFCGAESGFVPVSAVAPDVLMSEIELQRIMKKSEKGPILPSPWTGGL